MTFSSDDVNVIFYRYLRESGFEHSAFAFAAESNIKRSNIDVLQVPNGALISILQKGLQYVGVEIELDNEGSDVEDLVNELTLIDAAKPDILEIIKMRKERQKNKTTTVCNNSNEGNDNNILMNSDEIDILPSCLRRLSNLDSVIYAWNPIANLLAGGFKDGIARTCDIDNVADLNKIIFNHPFAMPDEEEPNNKQVTCLDWSFDGNYLAVGSFDGKTTVLTTDGRPACNFEQYGPILALKWNQRGNYILTGGIDGTTNIWNSQTSNDCIEKFHFHSAPVLDVAWKTNTTFASCSADTFIYVCQLNKEEPLKKFHGHTREINNIEWDPQGKFLASCSEDTTLKIWSMKKDTCVSNFEAHSKEVFAVKWSPTGSGSKNPNKNLILASSSLDGTIRLWDVESSCCLRTLTHNEKICAMDFSPDGRFLVSGSHDGFVCIWSVQSGEVVHSIKANDEIFNAAWNYRGDQIAVSSFEDYVFILDVRKL